MDLKRTRWVRRLDDGTYTIESNSNLQKQKELCDLCGIAEKCPINSARQKLQKAGVQFHLNTCERYVPLLAFRNPIIGLDTPYFNTLRSGATWAGRLSEGKIVCLVNSSSNQRIRFAKVDRIAVGPIDKMLAQHSRFNHLCMGGEPIQKVEEVIRKSYGHFLKSDSQLTAIYLKNIDREFDLEYHSPGELGIEDPRPKADVVDMKALRERHEKHL